MTHAAPSRRRLLLSTGIGLLQVTGGCSIGFFRESHYVVEFSALLASQDGKHLVAFTDKHHHVFDVPPALAQSIRSPLHADLRAEFAQFVVRELGEITGSVTLFVAADAPAEQSVRAIALGYSRPRDDAPLQLSIALHGKRYVASALGAQGEAFRLNRTYRVSVKEELSADSKVANAVLSPIYIAGGGLLMLGMVALMPIGFGIQCMRGCK